MDGQTDKMSYRVDLRGLKFEKGFFDERIKEIKGCIPTKNKKSIFHKIGK